MAPHRGSTIYIPIIIPENWQLAVSLICGFVGLVCLLFALFTSSWSVTTLSVPETSTTYPLKATITWGLRSIHIQWCVTRTRPESTYNTEPPGGTLTSCASEDIQYRKCGGSDGYWCSSASDPYLAYWMIILSCVGLVLSTIFALSRRVFQPIGYSICVIACSIAIMIFRTCIILFEPSGELLDWISNASTYDASQGVSYFVMTGATFILLIGMFMASWGTFKISRRAQETAPHSVEQPAAGQGQPTANARNVAPQQTTQAATSSASPSSPQLRSNERVLSILASAPNRVAAGEVAGSSQAQPAVNKNAGLSSIIMNGGHGPVRRQAVDNEAMDFEALNEPSAVALAELATPAPVVKEAPATIPTPSVEAASNADAKHESDSPTIGVPAAVSSPSQPREGGQSDEF